MKPRTITIFDFLKGTTIEVARQIAHLKGPEKGPNVVFIGGMHGNEPTGVLALSRVMGELSKFQPLLHGSVYAFAGNLAALERGERYITQDLNRIWQAERVDRARTEAYKPEEIIGEVEEQIELWKQIERLLEYGGKHIFIDLHTTSGPTPPFITMSDTLANHKLARKLPVPVVLGIEEYVNEPLLSYLDDLGHTSIAFEGGSHRDARSVEHHEALIWMVLVQAGVLRRIEVPGYSAHREVLRRSTSGCRGVYDIAHVQRIAAGERFEMRDGYSNFQSIQVGEELAMLHSHRIYAPTSGKIFMPLYQTQGSEGFFIIRKLPGLLYSMLLFIRRMGIDQLLSLLPGVSRFVGSRHTLAVNSRKTSAFTMRLLTLMGYRRRLQREHYTLLKRRRHEKGDRG